MTVRRAMIQTLASRQGSLVIRAVGTALLARLLAPEDFGLFAIAVAAYALALTLIDFGLPSFLIRRETVDRAILRSAIGLSWTLAVACAGLAAAALILLPESVLPAALRPVLGVMAVGLLVQPLIMPIEAGLQREMRFGLISILSLVKVVVQTAVAAGLAVAGFGVVALAAGMLAETVAAAVVLVAAAGRGRLAWPSFGGWRPLLGFGARYSATGLLSDAGDAVIVGAIGKLLGFGPLGAFNRAQTVVRLMDRSLLEGIAPVVLPAFSRSLRQGAEPARLYLLKVGHLTALCWPVFAVIALAAEPLVAVLLGAQWQDTVPAVRLLALSGLFLPITRMSMKLFVALDLTGTYLRLSAINQLIRVGLVAGGAAISLEAACLGVSLAIGVKAAMISATLESAIGYRVADLLPIAGRAVVITVTSAIGPAALLAALPAVAAPVLLVAVIAAAALGWVAGTAATRHPLLAEGLSAAGLHRLATAVSPPRPLS
ncbi:MAG: oligosaccharide flippase family protein [Azospirillaceae bacterium]